MPCLPTPLGECRFRLRPQESDFRQSTRDCLKICSQLTEEWRRATATLLVVRSPCRLPRCAGALTFEARFACCSSGDALSGSARIRNVAQAGDDRESHACLQCLQCGRACGCESWLARLAAPSALHYGRVVQSPRLRSECLRDLKRQCSSWQARDSMEVILDRRQLCVAGHGRR